MTIIKTSKALAEYCKTLISHDFITVDTEFLREKTYYPTLCLIQVGTPDKKAVAIDPLAEGIDLRPLFEVLFNEDILKIFHAARQDLEIIYNLTGKVVTPFFDTQIAAMVCGYGESIGYLNLVKSVTGKQLDKSSQFTDWSRRPLSDKQIDYALADVTHLVDVYKNLDRELEKRGRTSWVFQEEETLADPATYENKPEDMWTRIKVRSPKPKMLALLKALAAWREQRAQDKNIPKFWVMRDETLADMAAQAPKTPEALGKIRNMPKGIANGNMGKVLTDIIKDVEAQKASSYPVPEQTKRLSPKQSACVDILKMLLKINAAQADVAPKLIASKEDLESLAIEEKPDIPAMKGWRYEIFGEDALHLKNGALAITFKNGRIVKTKI